MTKREDFLQKEVEFLRGLLEKQMDLNSKLISMNSMGAIAHDTGEAPEPKSLKAYESILTEIATGDMDAGEDEQLGDVG